MTKEEIVAQISIDTGYNRVIVSDVVESMLRQITSELAAGGEVTFRRFGTFKMKKKKDKKGFDFRTGETISLPGKSIPSFKPSEVLEKITAV